MPRAWCGHARCPKEAITSHDPSHYNMPPYRPSSDSSDNEDAPEAVTLTQSKKAAEEEFEALRSFEANRKEKKRAQNRERDRKLKAQASNSRRKDKRAVATGDKVNVETEEEAGDLDEHRTGRKGSNAEVDDEGSEEQGGDSDSDGMEEDDNHGFDMSHPDHLPDHLFASAFASKPKVKASTVEARKRKGRKKRDGSAKDIVLG